MGKFAKYSKKYNPLWETEDVFKGWLKESKVKAGAFCKICKSELRAQKHDLKKHANTQQHQQNLIKYKFTPTTNTLTNLGVISTATISAEMKKLELLLTSYIVFHGAVKSIDHLSDVLNQNVLTKQNLQLHRTKCSALIKNVISQALLVEICDELDSSSYSLILDESTDISNVKYMAICIRFFSKKKSLMQTDYLGMFEVARARSEDLYEGLKSFLNSNRIDISKMVAIGTDGASNMIGETNSLFALLKKDIPTLELNKCVCHSINLCSEKECKELPSNLEFIVKETYNWFSHSPLRQINYQAIYSLINDGATPLKLVAPGKTRWLSRFQSIHRILQQWIELQQHFEISKIKEKCYSANLLFEMYKDKLNYLYFLFLQPILKELNDTNLLFQSENVDVEKFFENLKSLVMSVCSRILTTNFKNYLCEKNWDINILSTTLENKLSFTSVEKADYGILFESKLKELKLNCIDIETIKTQCFNFLLRLTKELIKRLPTNLNSLEKLKYSPQVCLSQVRPEFKNLFINYKGDLGDLENQWRNLLTVNWCSVCPNGKILGTIEFWSIVLNYKNALRVNCFEKLAVFVLNQLTIPVSNATVERVFSIMNAVKTKARNRMSLEMLDVILRIRLYCYGRGLCCKTFPVSTEMLNLFTSQMYMNLTNNDVQFEEACEVIDFVNIYET